MVSAVFAPHSPPSGQTSLPCKSKLKRLSPAPGFQAGLRRVCSEAPLFGALGTGGPASALTSDATEAWGARCSSLFLPAPLQNHLGKLLEHTDAWAISGTI